MYLLSQHYDFNVPNLVGFLIEMCVLMSYSFIVLSVKVRGRLTADILFVSSVTQQEINIQQPHFY